MIQFLFSAKSNGYKTILKYLILIICVGQLDVFASVFQKEPLPFEFEEGSFPNSDELVHNEELIKRSGKHTYMNFLLKIRYGQS